ncbi:hypothetical protein D9M72_540420 [compost metagenome]
MTDMDHHPGTVDILHLQSADFPDPQTRRIGACQRHPRLQAGNGLEELNDLVSRQNNGECARLARIRDPLGHIILAQRDAVEKPESADDLVQRCPGYPCRDQMNLEGVNIVKIKPIR